jgi:two-component system sensor histidine kinase PilS (NtrC family)
MLASDAERVESDPELAWRVLGILNIHRLLVPTLLVVDVGLGAPLSRFGAHEPELYRALLAGWFAVGVFFIGLLKWRRPRLTTQAYLQAAADMLALVGLAHASGGIASGLGLLLLVPIGAVSLLVTARTAVLLAALGALLLLGQQISLILRHVADTGSIAQAGILGAIVFLVAVAAAPLATRLRESEALVRQRELDLANLADLSQYVVERLRESLVVVDASDSVRLINESARKILGSGDARPGALLGEISPRLLYLLETWRQNPRAPATEGTLLAADSTREVRPHFASLGGDQPCPAIIFLEDVSAIAERVQQSKLAALGRLSASIAHEIRNPVGAMSHAAQLLAEAPGLSDGDRRLTEIIRGNSERVSAIIANVLQLSRREATRPERLTLAAWLEDFLEEFRPTFELPAERTLLEAGPEEIEVRFDPSHLRQVLWNLCENARNYAMNANGCPLELRIGRLAGNGRPFLEVADRGPGIDPAAADRIFEPFFTLHRSGIGLGLFLARELAECNGALLVYEPRAGGGSIFRLVFADPQRWQEV